jgi:hypothetical protein
MTEGKKDDTPKPRPENHIDVEIVTTSGSWPHQGYEDVPVHQKIRVQLEKAAKQLHIADTNGWIATVSDKEINIDASYQENGLTGKVSIDYGPREGGGGCE